MKEPKVLVISHNVFDMQKNMGRTLMTMFSEWNSENLAQLYFYNENPRYNICKKYYRVTDFDVLYSLVGKNYTGNISVSEKDTDTNNDKNKKRVYKFARKRKPYQYLARNLIWKFGKWYTEELREWVREFHPDVIFFAAGGYSFAYRVALKIAKDIKVPIVPYFCDDFYFVKRNNKSILDVWVKYDIKKYIRKIISIAKTYVCITESMEIKYYDVFKKKGIVIMTGTTPVDQDERKEELEIKKQNSFVLSYVGRLGLGRDRSLLDLGNVIVDTNLPIQLDVYTTETDPKIINNLTLENGISFKGALPGELVAKVLKNSDGVLHIESFDEKMRDKTRYSISTKIPDMLFSGRCSVAYGPRDIASISYLAENEVAVVINNTSEIYERLNELLNPDIRQKYVENAKKIAYKNHNQITNSKILKNKLESIL